MEILAIIPARGGSKGVPGKNIKEIAGIPLIAHIITEARNSKYLSRIIVSTDDVSIADVCIKYGAEVPFLRPAHLATDASPTIDAIRHAIDHLQNRENYFPDFVCLLQCTAPLTTVKHIDGAYERLLETGMDGVVSICEAEVHPYWTQAFEGDQLVDFIIQDKKILRRQDLPKVYRLNGAIWIIRTSTLLAGNSLIADRETGYVMDIDDSVDIDSERDFHEAEARLKARRSI